MAIRMRRGNEADFDPSKMLPGEWAVSTDTKYVRMCFSPGIVLRMATYEAFESDMAEIRKILSQCQNIQTAVKLIQQNVTASELVIENYVKETKQYRDEAEQFRNEAFATTPEGYEDLVKNVSDNTVKIDTVLEKAGLKFDNTVKGSNIHLTDSADSNVLALELYGKTEQNAYTGKNLFTFPNIYYNGTGLNITKSTDETYLLNGTSTGAELRFYDGYNSINKRLVVPNGTYKIVATINGEEITSTSTFAVITNGKTYASHYGTSFEITDGFAISSMAVNLKVGKNYTNSELKIMVCKQSEDNVWEPYVGGMPSPSPSYPQEIKSVVLNTIKTHGKNLLDMSVSEGTKAMSYNQNSNSYVQTSADTRTDFWLRISLLKEYSDATPSILVYENYTQTECVLTTTFKKKKGYNYLFIRHNGSTKDVGVYFNISHLKDGVTYYFKMNIVNATQGSIEFGEIIISETESDYIPYQSSEITLSKPIELNGFNGVYDVLTSEGVTRRFAQVVFDGSDDEAWSLITANGGNQFAISISDNGTREFMCTHFVNSGVTNWGNVPDGTYMVHPTIFTNIRFRYDAITSVADFKMWLTENPITIVYELATPTTEELQTDFTVLKTFYPETYVSNDADCDMSITYTADAKNYIDNKLALLTTAIYNNI